jgi:hypothetical protein
MDRKPKPMSTEIPASQQSQPADSSERLERDIWTRLRCGVGIHYAVESWGSVFGYRWTCVDCGATDIDVRGF